MRCQSIARAKSASLGHDGGNVEVFLKRLEKERNLILYEGMQGNVSKDGC